MKLSEDIQAMMGHEIGLWKCREWVEKAEKLEDAEARVMELDAELRKANRGAEVNAHLTKANYHEYTAIMGIIRETLSPKLCKSIEKAGRKARQEYYLSMKKSFCNGS